MLYTLSSMAFADDVLTCVNKEYITMSDVTKVAQMHCGAKEYEALDESLKKKILKGLQDKLLVIGAAKRTKLEESPDYKGSYRKRLKIHLVQPLPQTVKRADHC